MFFSNLCYTPTILAVFVLVFVTESNQSNDLHFRTRHNCSHYKPIAPYDISEFVGSWNYVRLFTEERLRVDMNCIKMKARVNKSTIVMNITIPNPQVAGLLRNTVVFGALSEKTEKTGQWVFFSESPLAPSKWIILAQKDPAVLYMICGDFPDGTSAVGEIGILSRDTKLPDEVAVGFRTILKSYDLDVHLPLVQHSLCPAVLVPVGIEI